LAQIQVLAQHVADLIAAGEVVSKPASVVKELVENSIDAGSTSVTVEISSGGMELIRVSDNGSGIAPEDIKTAFLRHATSKLYDARELEAIETLGFRGEALAAIAAVSRVEITSRHADANEGVLLTLSAGEVLNMSPAGAPVGTTILIRDLFFNTPARFKFMKTDRAEAGAVSSILLRIALSRPDISFRYIKDGKVEFHTPGDSSVSSCIYSLLGREFEAGFLEVNLTDENVSVKGFSSKFEALRGNRNNQYFFVNGRAVRSPLLQSALEQAYRNNIPIGRFPSCVLYIDINPASVDVNVHPAKTEVKFLSDKQIFDGVYYATLGALEKTKAASPQATDSYTSKTESVSNYNTIRSGHFQNLFVSEPATNYNSANPPKPSPQIPKIPRSLSFLTKEDLAEPVSLVSQDFHIIGEAFCVYIIVEFQDSVWFIDKHAVHERIHFDTLKSGNYQPMSETLLTPVICSVGHEDAALLQEHTEFLSSMGFTVESFGDDSVAVRHIPADIDISDVEFVLYQMCLKLAQGDTSDPLTLDDLYRIIACKAAIKAGSSSEEKELEELVKKVVTGEITHCPHGRPVFYIVPKTTLEKNIGRV